MQIKARLWTCISGLAALLSIGLIAGCPTPEPPNGNNQNVVDAENFVLEAGATRTVEQDLTIRASGIVMIDGDLMVDQDRGQKITIEAEGDVVVSGRIVAGNANPNADTARSLRSQPNASRIGGNVSIESKNGSIILMESARITAGDGADGVLNEDGMTGGAGGRGGDVIFTAPNGSLTLPNARGVIHLGNGGRGADVSLTDARLDPTTLPEDFDNIGGRSGVPLIDVAVIEGIVPETITLEEELIDVRGQRVGGPGDVITTLNLSLDPNPFTGGIGGDSGSITVELALPQDTAKRRQRSMEGDDPPEVVVEGKEGATGWFTGGKGGDARAIGNEGAEPGANGADALATGGTGGLCGNVFIALSLLTSVECAGGAGGDAFALGGNGAFGEPGQDGGEGGKASAFAGSSPINAGVKPTACGDATARGGDGGNGGSACDMPQDAGDGGDGGLALALVSFPGLCPTGQSQLNATGGKGGKGGDDLPGAGTGGDGGSAQTDPGNQDAIASATATRGENGAPGGGCPFPGDDDDDDDMGNGDDTDDDGDGDGDGDDDDNGDDNDDDDDPADMPMLEKIFTMTIMRFPSRPVPSENCAPGTSLIALPVTFEIPADAKKVFVAVTGLEERNRIDVQVEHVPDRGSTNEIINVCGRDQNSNTTSFNFVPENKGTWLIAIADSVFVADSYEICIQIER